MSKIDPTLLDVPSGALVLDLGTGSGATARELSHRNPVVAVDVDYELLRAASPQLQRDRILRCASLSHCLALRSASIDAAVVLEVLEHVDDVGGSLDELARVVRSGGRLCVAVPTGYTERVFDRLHPRYSSNATHVRIFRRHEILDAISASGFRVDVVRTENLEWALIFLIHSLLRTDADPFGNVRSHLWVNRLILRAFAWKDRHRRVSRLVAPIAGRAGKSWYVYASRR